MKLSAVKFNPEKSEFDLNSDFSKMIHDKLQSLYEIIGYREPWVGYFAIVNNQIVGSCGFKNPPDADRKVEIAYTTMPEFEKKGYASEMCKKLIEIAHKEDPTVMITAQTLKTNIPSHKILLKNRFIQSGINVDDEYGEILEWTYAK